MSAEKKDTVPTTEPAALWELYRSAEHLLEPSARRIARMVGLHPTLDELMSAGRFALIAAARRYDPDFAVPFPGFAHPRILGGMLDEARATGRVPRRDRERGTRVVSLEALEAAEHHSPLFATALTDDGPLPDEAVEARITRRLLRRRLEGLDPRAVELLDRHYFGGEDFDQIAADIGVSKSWASRIHSAALATLRERVPRELLA